MRPSRVRRMTAAARPAGIGVSDKYKKMYFY
jgi:hypothetical protein